MAYAVHEAVAGQECPCCKSYLKFSRSDWRQGADCEWYVNCPVCDEETYVKDLEWWHGLGDEEKVRGWEDFAPKGD